MSPREALARIAANARSMSQSPLLQRSEDGREILHIIAKVEPETAPSSEPEDVIRAVVRDELDRRARSDEAIFAGGFHVRIAESRIPRVFGSSQFNTLHGDESEGRSAGDE